MNAHSQRDMSISLIRLFATCCIIACHMMQWANLELAWWFNVGVQIFLCMSGYLYGIRNIENTLDFLKKNFKKILTDYYIVVTIAILFLAFTSGGELSLINIVKVYLTSATLPGGDHLWFIPYILFSYLITPLFNQLFDRVLKSVGGIKIFIILGCILVGNALFLREFTQFSAVWVNCYILGMFFGKLKFHARNRELAFFKVTILFLALIMNGVQIITDYTNILLYSTLPGGHLVSMYFMFFKYAHVFLGLALFMVLYDVFTAILKKREWPLLGEICAVSDKYSYRVYLVHQWVIFGPFSMMEITPWRVLNIGFILICIIILVLIVEVIDQSIERIKK